MQRIYTQRIYPRQGFCFLDFQGMTFGERLQLARLAAGLTQVQLAQQLGVRQNQVSQWEADNTGPKRQRLPALAAAVKASIEWLLSGVGEAPAGAETAEVGLRANRSIQTTEADLDREESEEQRAARKRGEPA